MFVLHKNNIMGQTWCLNIVNIFYMLCFNDVQYMNFYSDCVVTVH